MRKSYGRIQATFFPEFAKETENKEEAMEKSKLTPEGITKLLREHAELLSLIQYAPEPGSASEDYEKWWEKRKSLLEKIQKQ